MLKRVPLLLFLSLTFNSVLFSQTITGSIYNKKTNKLIPSVQILVKTDTTSNTIEQYTIAKNGKFTLQLIKDYSKIFIIAQALNYHKEMVPLTIQSRDVNQLVIKLEKKSPNEIEEIVIEAERERMYRRKDTMVYVVDQFRDGTERKVEDVLKKCRALR